jgi:hypothetical protein
MHSATNDPGEIADQSGIYQEIGTSRRVTVVENKRFPPTSKPNHKYKLIIATKK